MSLTAKHYEIIFRGLRDKYGQERVVAAFDEFLPSLRAAMDGGDGSGNFNHAGRPGEVGGSAETKKSNMTEQKYQKDYERVLSEVTPDVRNKMEAVKIDFTKDNVLPEMNKEDADYLGIKVRPFRLKKKIIDRQALVHPLSADKTNKILSCALYNSEFIGGKRENGYVNFISSLTDNRNPLVLVDVQESEDGYYDIVHYYFLTNRKKAKKMS